MARMRRKKSDDATYHIMCRSISEVDLFKDDDDKDRYMNLIKKYQKLYSFRVYGCCLMTNHAHMIIFANGADIPKIMHSLKFCYAQYFNNRHKRHGHLFQDRFKSKIVNHEDYIYLLSAHIHNNPMAISDYTTCPEKFEYSSLAAYVGLKEDIYGILDVDFILSMLGKSKEESIENYIKFVYRCDEKEFKSKEIEFENEKIEYRSGRSLLVREYKEKDVIEFVCNKMKINKVMFYAKGRREVVKALRPAVV